jgi:hypothetical protein
MTTFHPERSSDCHLLHEAFPDLEPPSQAHKAPRAPVPASGVSSTGHSSHGCVSGLWVGGWGPPEAKCVSEAEVCVRSLTGSCPHELGTHGPPTRLKLPLHSWLLTTMGPHSDVLSVYKQTPSRWVAAESPSEHKAHGGILVSTTLSMLSARSFGLSGTVREKL